MNLKNRKYMKNAEFKTRQIWLAFIDATGIALEAIAEGVNAFREWFKKWSKKPSKKQSENKAGELDFTKTRTEKHFIDVSALNYFGIASRWCVLSRNSTQQYCIKSKRENHPEVFKEKNKLITNPKDGKYSLNLH